MAGELAGYVPEEDAWPEIMPFIRTMISSPNAEHRESALQLFGMVVGHFVPYIDEQYQTIAALLQVWQWMNTPTAQIVHVLKLLHVNACLGMKRDNINREDRKSVV